MDEVFQGVFVEQIIVIEKMYQVARALFDSFVAGGGRPLIVLSETADMQVLVDAGAPAIDEGLGGGLRTVIDNQNLKWPVGLA